VEVCAARDARARRPGYRGAALAVPAADEADGARGAASGGFLVVQEGQERRPAQPGRLYLWYG
jgi:hypothetical protein